MLNKGDRDVTLGSMSLTSALRPWSLTCTSMEGECMT